MTRNGLKFFLLFLSAFLFAAPFLFPSFFLTAWIALVPFFWLVGQSKSAGQALFLGWATGWFANLIGFYWLVHTISVFGGFSYPISALIFLIFAALEACEFTLFSAFVRRFGSGTLFVLPALFWVTLEFWFPHLFPWYLASTQTRFHQLTQSADILGPYGVSFLVVWVNRILYKLLRAPAKQSRGIILAAAIFAFLLAGAVVYGQRRVSTLRAAMARAPAINVAAIQGNIDIMLKWDASKWRSNLASYQGLTKAAKGASLIIWPETAVEPWMPDDIQKLPSELREALPQGASYFIFGARSFLGKPESKDFKAFNSAFLADGEGRIVARYHKQVLMAFGEYLPFSGILSKIPGVPPIGDGFSRGGGPHTLDLSSNLRVGPLICYEDLMPSLARSFVSESRANLLVNLTNDAWYGNTVAPWQHLRLAEWRAIETRRYLVRATNTGVTAVVDPLGLTVRVLPTFSPGVLSVPVRILNGETLYVRFGDWFAWLITLIAVAAVLQGYFREFLRRLKIR